MSQVTTAFDLIVRSMRLISAVAAGEIPEDADLNDAFITLNEMFDSWNLQPLAVFDSPNEDFVVTPGKASYLWGITAGAGNITSDRPIFLNNATCTRNGLTTPVEIITQTEYDAISLKTTQQSLIERVLYVNSFPLGQLICFPVPFEAVTLNLNTARQLGSPIALQSQIVLPPGYQRAIRYNLAVELWPEYSNSGVDIASIKQIAADSLGLVKSANNEVSAMTFEGIPTVDIARSWDWRVG